MELTSCYAHTCMYARANVSNFHCAKKFSPMACIGKIGEKFSPGENFHVYGTKFEGEDSHEGEVGEIPPLGPV